MNDGFNGYRPGMTEEEVKETIYQITEAASNIAHENIAIIDFFAKKILKPEQLKALLSNTCDKFDFADMEDLKQQCEGLLLVFEKLVDDPEMLGLRTSLALIIHADSKFPEGHADYQKIIS